MCATAELPQGDAHAVSTCSGSTVDSGGSMTRPAYATELMDTPSAAARKRGTTSIHDRDSSRLCDAKGTCSCAAQEASRAVYAESNDAA